MKRNYLRYVKIVGTMHVSPQSREEVHDTIEECSPDAVALEIDEARLYGVLGGRRSGLMESLTHGAAGLLNYVLATLEWKLGDEFGMSPGEEMAVAYETALQLGISVYLIDQDVRLTLSRLLGAPMREKVLLALESVVGLFGASSIVDEDILSMDGMREILREFKSRYPYLYTVLIEDRNRVMAANLVHIVEELRRRVARPKVVAVVGMGHVEGLSHLLNSWVTVGEHL